MAIAPHVRRFFPRFWFFCRFLRYWYWRGENEIHMLRHFVPRGRTALDVGSSVGLYSRALARLVPKVIAFEANPEVAALARTVARPNVEVINDALSSSQGRAVLRIPVNRRGRTVNDSATIERNNIPTADSFMTIEVATMRLDDYDFTDCGFIKIDAEAHEEAVLDGAERLLQTCRPVLMIELDERVNPGAIDRVTTRLQQAYNGYFLSYGKLWPVSEFRQTLHQNIDAHMALPPRKRKKAEYINNFIFIPREMRPPAIVGEPTR
jgi:FkbM family methyltransferase